MFRSRNTRSAGGTISRSGFPLRLLNTVAEWLLYHCFIDSMMEHETTNGPNAAMRTLLGVCLMFALTCSHAEAALAFQDNFANRQTTTEPTDRLDGNNATATVEPGEPLHGGKEGGRSVWLTWVAPTNGIATFWTVNSASDTLLSAYSLPTGGTNVSQLVEVARNDDDPANPEAKLSLIQFGAIAGQRYEIAVDGYRGSSGDFRLRWDFVATTSAPPVIVTVPSDQAVREGDTVTLAVTLQSATPLDVDWRYNGNSFAQGGPTENSIGEHTTTLVITNFQATNVGVYSLRIRLDTRGGSRVEFNTTPVELQLNSEGQTNVIARDKLFDSFGTSLVGDDGNGGGHDSKALSAPRRRAKAGSTGVVRGYDGSQIFNTTYATTDPTEPHHCGFTPSASYWFTYQPPTNGTAMVDTSASHYDNVVAAYTYTGTVTSYADLVPICCDHGSAGANASRIEFAALRGQQYVVVVAGVNGARGIASLKYHLDVARPPVPPTVTNPVSPLVVVPGVDVTLQPGIIGSPPLHFQWNRTNAPIAAATNSSLQLLKVTTTNSGEYVLNVWNHIGATNVIMPLRVVIPPQLDFKRGAAADALSFIPIAGQRYVIETTAALGEPWIPAGPSFVSDGGIVSLTNSFTGSNRFYRVRVE